MSERKIDIHMPVTVCKASAGTGKTYTLAAYYVGLLLSGEDYRSILAITFTNKATSEMSERILGYLYALSLGGEPEFLLKAREFMIRDVDAPDALLQRRAGEYFRKMLLDFDNVQIRTIDSFQQMLLKGLASMLRQSAGMNTELDSDHVIGEAVEQLLTTEMTEQDLAIIRDFLHVRLEEEGTVYIKKSLCALAQEMYNESVQMLEADEKIDFDAQQIAQRRARIAARRETAPQIVQLRAELEQLWSQINAAYVSGAYDGKGKGPVGNALKNIRMSLDAPETMKPKDRFRGMTEKAYAERANEDAVLLSDKAHECRAYYATVDLSIALSHEMQLMTSLQSIIQRNLNDANCALMSRTAAILNSALKEGDADFILEKAGIRYHHVLMDEFQDTSQLQWSVIEKLLRDIVAGEGNTLLIVGDIKQSIYRWRNGDWHIMDALTDAAQAHPLTTGRRNPHLESLQKNYRSSEEVVRFNLSLFNHIIAAADDPLVKRIYDEGFRCDGQIDNLYDYYQADKKPGGYVRFLALEDKDACLTQLFDTMEQLLPSIPASDMMVLVRGKADAQLITRAHAALDPNEYPNLSRASFVSATSFQLDASEAVNTVIAALRLVENPRDEIAAYQVSLAVQKPDVIEQIRANVTRRTPLYEAICELVKILWTDENGQYTGTETAYINNLLDRTRAYVQTYGSDRTDFLQYWDENMHEKPIPTAATGAIPIMTIHKSKGLQRQTLFIPFCNWDKDEGKASSKIWCPIAPILEEGEDYIPIPAVKDMAISAYDTYYEREHSDLRVDSINMLYVALTRAEDNLFVFTDYKLDKNGQAPKHVGAYIVDFIGKDFEAGQVKTKAASGKPKGEQDKPFSFAQAPVSTAELWANSAQVRFIQSQEGALYTELGDEAYRRVARMDFGTLCHAIFASIHTKDELDQVLDEFESRGEIKSADQREQIRTLISRAWYGNEQMHSWFVDPWELKLEEAILDGDKEIRPDRVMIDRFTNDAIVLDYKFGHFEPSYLTQVRKYMDALRQLGHPHVKGYLWFAQENKLVEVKDEQ